MTLEEVKAALREAFKWYRVHPDGSFTDELESFNLTFAAMRKLLEEDVQTVAQVIADGRSEGLSGEAQTLRYTITQALAAQIFYADEVCYGEGIGPHGGQWGALLLAIRTEWPALGCHGCDEHTIRCGQPDYCCAACPELTPEET